MRNGMYTNHHNHLNLLYFVPHIFFSLPPNYVIIGITWIWGRYNYRG